MSPPALPPQRDQSSTDSGHLDLLAIFHFVLAGFSVLALGFLFLHWMIMHTFIEDPRMWEQAKGPVPPKEFFDLFQWFYLFMGTWAVIIGIGNLVSGFFIKRRVSRTFSLVIAGFDCLVMPFGTALGVFTIIVLMRPSVQHAYHNPATVTPHAS